MPPSLLLQVRITRTRMHPMQASAPDKLHSAPPAMPRQQYNTGLLCGLALLGWLYAAWLYTHPTLTGSNFWDAVTGVLLGIYICSRPVGNLMDMLYTQQIRWQELKKRAGMIWLVMNFITTFTGWATIVLGATRLVRPE